MKKSFYILFLIFFIISTILPAFSQLTGEEITAVDTDGDGTPDISDPDPEVNVEVELVESIPLETNLDMPDVRNAHEVWLEMIEGAEKTLDIAQFYIANKEGELMEDILDAIISAAERGVTVRVILEQKMIDTYPESVKVLQDCEKISLGIYDIKNLTGGINHAKYFIVDGEEVFVGSQNMDWRALNHIHEVGLRIKSRAIAKTLERIFEADWKFCKGENVYGEEIIDRDKDGIGDEDDPSPQVPTWEKYPGENVEYLYLVSSPPELNPSGINPAGEELLRLIEEAHESIEIQLLTYSLTDYSGEYWDVLDKALRDAAAGGVHIRMILSDWCKSKPLIDYIKDLSQVENIEIKLGTIPEWSGGFISFARVEHCKYMVIDNKIAWVGTSNWSKDYFYSSRNIEIVTGCTDIVTKLSEKFEAGWNGDYVYFVDPHEDYEPPKITDGLE